MVERCLHYTKELLELWLVENLEFQVLYYLKKIETFNFSMPIYIFNFELHYKQQRIFSSTFICTQYQLQGISTTFTELPTFHTFGQEHAMIALKFSTVYHFSRKS
jgi:hypothetical protein